MSISDRLLGKKAVNGKPHIESVAPSLALPGGEVRIIGKSLRPHELRRPVVRFREGEASGSVVVGTNGHVSNPHVIKVAAAIAGDLHPVANPAIDREGNI